MSVKQEVEITVPVEELQKETDQVVATIKRKAKLPGFRPGKAPDSLIRTRFKNEIQQDVLENVIPKAFRQRAEEEHWDVVNTPNVTDVHHHEGEPLRFKAAFEVAPQIELGAYTGLDVPYAEPQVSPEDIAGRLQSIRERKSEYVNEDPRPLADGDHAVVSIESVAGVEGEPVKSDEMVLHLGDAETMPAFTENLRGVSPEEEREFDVEYPQDYGQEKLAGKTVRFKVHVKGVRRKDMPELNDEFAKDLGDYQSLEEVREAIRRSISAEREQAARNESIGKLLDLLVETHTFEVPDSYVDRQIDMNLERQLRELAQQGIDPTKLNLDWTKLRETHKERAEKDVRASLILEKVADRESIHATQDEVDGELQRAAKQAREPLAATRMKFEKDGTLGRIAGRIRTEKVLNFLFENAKKVAPVPEATVDARDAVIDADSVPDPN